MPKGQPAHSLTILEMALIGYETQKEKIESKIREIQAQLKGPQVAAAARGRKKAGGKRVLSAAARARIAAAQKKRWAEFRKRQAKG